MHMSLDKAAVVSRIRAEGDTVPDLLAWTKNQPTNRLPATYNRKGNVWETLMAFRNEQLEKLPDVVTPENIAYLLETDDKRCWMFYTIICWILLAQSNVCGMEEKSNKATIFQMFRTTQEKKLLVTT